MKTVSQFETTAWTAPQPRIDLSVPDNSEYEVGRSRFLWALWHFVGSPLVRSNVLPISRLKVQVLRLFGATIGLNVYVKPGLQVKFPWYLTIGDHCWIGENVWIDNLAHVTVGSHACISQAAYLCTGNHDWTSTNMKLFRRPIILGDGCWVGAKATIGPGVVIGECAILGIGAVTSKNVPPYEIWSGNPAAFVRKRELKPHS